MENIKNNKQSVGFFGLLTIAFIVLKLAKVITWSWWWVLAPVWAPIALVLFGFLVYILINAKKL